MTRSRKRCGLVLGGMIVCLAIVGAAHAEAPRAPGSSTGDGSTPFTGLAQAPEANLFVGAATTSIPIAVPPGRKGVTPQLALSYSSAAGPGPYGYGWDLPLGKIQRSTKHGVLSCHDPTYRNDFVVVLPGANVECRLNIATNACEPVVQESFLRIQWDGANMWQVWDRSGLYYEFGSSANARTGTNPNYLFVAPCQYTFSWMLSRVAEPSGNTLEITYTQNQGTPYPESVRYGGNVHEGLAHLFEVTFSWIPRPFGDALINSMGGYAARLTQLLSRIEVHYPPGGGLVRAYGFSYDFQLDDSRSGRRAFLEAVTLYNGSDQALARADGLAASTTFRYHDNRQQPLESLPHRLRFEAPPQTATKPSLGQHLGALRWTESTSQGGFILDATHRDVFDINGDGIPDWVLDDYGVNDCRWRVYLGTASGFATTASPWELPPGWCAPIRAAHRWQHFGKTASDTVDVTGDGIPDLVDASVLPWRVFPGRAPTVSTPGGFYTPAPPGSVQWAAPFPDIRFSDSLKEVAGIEGTADLRDLIDLNADGLLDYVFAVEPTPQNPTPAWKVWFNTGSGFAAGPGQDFQGVPGGLRFTAVDSGAQHLGIYDINADGLPDQIFSYENAPTTWHVILNNGHDMGVAETWSFPAITCDQNKPYRAALRVPVSKTDASVIRDFVDVNGDGLPDIVDICGWSSTHKAWKVFLNRGGGRFDVTPQDWNSPSNLIRDIQSGNTSLTKRDVFDIDGDGMIDFVDAIASPLLIYHNGGGAWCTSNDGSTCNTVTGSTIAPNPIGGRPDLLTQLENGIGGTTWLRYRPSTQWDNADGTGAPRLPFVIWTVAHLGQDDGFCDDAGGCLDFLSGHTVQTTITYAYGMFTPSDREMRGFRTVQQVDAIDNRQTTWFHQDSLRKGKIEFTQASDPQGQPVQFAVNAWECVDSGGGQMPTCPATLALGESGWVRLRRATNFAATDFVFTHSSFTRNEAWDAYGNVTHATQGGTGAATVHTYTSYAYRLIPPYIVDKPSSVRMTDASATTLEEKWFLYDGRPLGQLTKGNLTANFAWLDQVAVAGLPQGVACPQSRPGSCVVTSMDYDAFGNVTTVVDANGNHVVTSYDDATRIYPFTVTNAQNHQVATQYDPACGKVVWRTVTYAAPANPIGAPRTAYAYDSFCRLSAVALPDEGLSSPHQQFYYAIGAPQQPTVVSVSTVEPWASGDTLWSDEFYDAMGRHMQSQREAVVDGTRAIVAAGTVAFDDRGNAVKRYVPFTLAPTDSVAYMAPPNGTRATTFQYDALGRATRVTNPDDSWRSIAHDVAWQTTTQNECQTSGDCAGGTVVDRRDAFGRTIERLVYDGGTLATRTGYTYDGLGRLAATKQGTTPTSWVSNTTITTQYDSLGRTIRTEDPDSGTWRYGYDLVGNLIYQDDPQPSQHRQFCYDSIDRLASKHHASTDQYDPAMCAAPPEVAYVYDEVGGLLACPFFSCTAGNCGLGRLTSVYQDSGGSATYCYDLRGRQTQVATVIAAAGTTTFATTQYQYDRADHLTQMTYPDGERVRYFYDAAGQTKRVKGKKLLVKNLTYDLFGRPRVLTRGNRTVDRWTYHPYQENFRLASIAISGRSGATLLNYGYRDYFPSGLLAQLDDFTPGSWLGPLDNSASFAYDGLGRMRGVEGPNLPYHDAYSFDSLGNMTRKEGTTLDYSAAQPHRLEKVNGSVVNVVHDANGNRRAKPGQSYAYDPEDRLTNINNGMVQFVYDHTGQRVAKISAGTVTRYYGNWGEAANGVLTKYYYAAGMLIASQQVANLQLSGLPKDPLVRIARSALGTPMLVLRLRDDARRAALFTVCVIATALLWAPWRRRRVVGIAVRHGHVVAIMLAFAVTSLPLPITVRPAAALSVSTLMHYHCDHLGSTQLITDKRGSVVAHLRYKPYGQLRGRFAADGTPLPELTCTAGPTCHEFTGYDTEPLSGLQYAGARFYDPALGMFLTHDPVRQFANPYNYGGGDPMNWTDPNGQFFWLAGLIPIIKAALVAAAISAAVNTVIAAAQGASLGQIGQAAAAGAIAGAVGVGIGVVAGAVSISLGAVAGSLPQNVGLQQAINALGEVAFRAAVSTSAANAVSQTAAAAGAPGAVVRASSTVAGYLASAVFDQFLLDYSGNLARLEGKGIASVSNRGTHGGVTASQARQAGYLPGESEILATANVKQDGPTGWSGFLSSEVWNNESHFDFGAQQAFRNHQSVAMRLAATGNRGAAFLKSVGAASHHLQDLYALGHTLPGTHLLAGPFLAPLRALVHQTVGGEVTLLGASRSATYDFLASMRSLQAT